MLFKFDDLIVGAVKLDGGESIVDYISSVFWQIQRIAKADGYKDVETLSCETECYLQCVKSGSISLDYRVILRFLECRYLMADLLDSLVYAPRNHSNTVSRLQKLIGMMRQEISEK